MDFAAVNSFLGSFKIINLSESLFLHRFHRSSNDEELSEVFPCHWHQDDSSTKLECAGMNLSMGQGFMK